MSRSKGIATLSGMVDTDMEDDTRNDDAFPTPDSNQENAEPKRKGAKAKSASKQTTKTRAPSRRTSGTSRVAKKGPAPQAKTKGKRAPLKEQTNQQYADDTDEVDEFAAQTEGDTAVDDSTIPKAKGKKAVSARDSGRPPKMGARQHLDEKQKDGEFEYTPTAVRTTKPGKEGPAPKYDSVIQETQPYPETIPSTLQDQDQDDQEMPQSAFRRPTGSPSKTRRPLTIPRRRAGSASSTDRPTGVSDAATRRKLGEMTRKLDTLDLKYRTLRETGIKDAESNFERLRTQSAAKAKAAHDLIASLKRELATQKALSANASTIQQQIDSREADLIKTRALADDLSSQLTEAQNENKALQARLAHSRCASTAVESLGAKTPGSAFRARQQVQGGRTIMVGSAEAAQAAQIAQLKEDMYSDLTGLIMRGVERGPESDVYDCIQTGRNGTLHFNLAITKDPDETYENTEFIYTPRLDSNRDRDLIALLPEYLTVEIAFARTNAAMLYAKVVETLTKRRSGDDE